MSESLNVIALISGGKDSFYSLLHCLENGHKVVALGNLYPAAPSATSTSGMQGTSSSNRDDHMTPDATVEEQDLNSYMYQTVGHTIIPLYEAALGIPLYRQQILGTAVQTELNYKASTSAPTEAIEDDETESLLPLLRTIMAAHPEANALSTGAILSTYQRSRIESVAIRLGLIPLAYLWQYPLLPPSLQISLLQDMQAAALDARIIKVASGGLDESYLWEDIASSKGMSRVERAMKRFGMDGDGAVLGEGGEFETLVVDGPRRLFRGRITMEESQRRVVREGGGSSWLALGAAKVEMKPGKMDSQGSRVRIPDLFDVQFSDALELLTRCASVLMATAVKASPMQDAEPRSILVPNSFAFGSRSTGFGKHIWTLAAPSQAPGVAIEQEMEDIMSQIAMRLEKHHANPSDLVSTIILLRSMADFVMVNKIYGALFKEPNPPARVTIACGDVLPDNCNVLIHWELNTEADDQSLRRGLHVQSRSYWAPANIGPYSQAHAIPLVRTKVAEKPTISAVHLAGQIPLIPASMSLPTPETVPDHLKSRSVHGVSPEASEFCLQAMLSLQHLWRIGLEMNVSWWGSAVAYLSHDSLSNIASKARLVGNAWAHQHHLSGTGEMDESAGDEERDLWEERYHGGFESRGGDARVKMLPDWSVVQYDQPNTAGFVPPLFAAEVMALPRGSAVEWHAHVGFTSGPVRVSMHCESDIGVIFDCIVGDAVAYTVIFIFFQPEIPSLKERIEEMRAHSRERTFGGDKKNGGYCGAYLSYVDAYVKGLWDVENLGGVIPCRSLWGGESRLAAVLLFETKS
ncbi:MAG: hypothetical protein M1818_005978 [Claussenomyces sp. TS43310]|nr:MAG: hypothetical protein M1818_005978 [Claussenomyces sp. TS43310]